MPDDHTAAPRLDPSAAARLLVALSADEHFTAEQLSASPAGSGREPHNDATGAPGCGMGLAGHTDSEGDLPPGLRIPGYTLVERLADGGGGTVFRAIRDGGASDHPLAIKLLRVRLGQPDSASSQRAWRELQILESLRLPATPRLLDYGHAAGHLFLVTEFIEGTPPDRYARQRSLSLRDCAALMADIAEAVQSLHEHGVMHRDLKPSNIVITPTGQPVILDLGLAALLEESSADTLTTEGQPIGTVAFMAPEQARGQRSLISTRTDVYALGAVGYFLTTGRTPHDTQTSLHEAIRRVSHDPPRAPRDLDPSVPAPLAAILSKACDPEPQRRYGSAADLAADLRRWLAGEPVSASPPTMWTGLLRRVARHPAIFTASICTLLIATAIAATFTTVWWINSRPCELRIDQQHGTWVRLLSFSGRILRSWNTSGPVVLADVVDRPAALGGGRVIVLGGGLAELAGPPATSGAVLAAYDLAHPASPLWVVGCTPPELQMPPLSGFTAAMHFDTTAAVVCDVFPQSPGAEIIAVHRHHPWAPTCIRIYDLGGRVLYEAWHNGYVTLPLWLAKPGLLIMAGVNSEVLWSGRAQPDVQEPFPEVVLAIKPQFGQKHGWISTPSEPGDLRPEFYVCLLPPAAGDVFIRGQLPSVSRAPTPDGDDHFVLQFDAMSITVDSRGRALSRVVYSQLRQRMSRQGNLLPDPDAFTLGELPPILPGADAKTRPANN